MEFKGTKGEWSQNGFSVFVGEKEIINENVICRFHCGLEKYQGSESKANAKLISCAPEMLGLINKHSKELISIIDSFEGILPYRETFIKIVNDSESLFKKATTI